MSCNYYNENGGQAAAGTSETNFFQMPGASKAGLFSGLDKPTTKRLLASGPAAAAKLQLGPGTYKQISIVTSNIKENKYVENVDHSINYKGELKRVAFSKIELRDIDEPQPGQFQGRQILEYKVIDGDLPPEIIAKAANDIVTGQPSASAKVKEVYQYTNFGLKEALVLAGTVLSIFFFGIKLLNGK